MIVAVKKCVAGLDVHKKTVMCTALTEKKGGVSTKPAEKIAYKAILYYYLSQ